MDLWCNGLSRALVEAGEPRNTQPSTPRPLSPPNTFPPHLGVHGDHVDGRKLAQQVLHACADGRARAAPAPVAAEAHAYLGLLRGHGLDHVAFVKDDAELCARWEEGLV